VHPVELVAQVAPGVAGGVLGDPDQLVPRAPAQSASPGTDALV